MNYSQLNLLLNVVTITLLSIALALVLYFLAKRKGRNARLYFVLGLVPGINGFATVYLVGAPDLTLHARVDRLLSEQQHIQASPKI